MTATSDTLPTATRVSDPGMRALYRLENRWQAWLDVEAALAHAQAELGIIPARGGGGHRRQGEARADGPQAHRRRLRPHRPYAGAAGLGTRPHRRRAARRLGALGRDHAEHHPDRRSSGAAPGARDHPAPDRRDRCRPWPISPNARPTCRWPGARTASTRCPPPSATRSPSGSTNCCATSSACARPLLACSSPCWAAAPAPSPRSASRGRRCRPGIGRQLGFGSMTVPSRALGDHLAENICILGLLAATCGKIGREVYTLDEDRVRRGRGAGAARHRRQLDHAAEAQSQALPGRHRRRGRGAQPGAAGARSHDDRARGRPHHQPDDGQRRGPRLHRHRRHAGPAGRDHARPAASIPSACGPTSISAAG